MLLRDAYDQVLRDHDLMIMPTIPFPGDQDPAAGLLARGVRRRSRSTCSRTPARSMSSGHPAFTVPCGMVNGLPVGMMLVGRHFDEATLIRVADAFEQTGDWQTALTGASGSDRNGPG